MTKQALEVILRLAPEQLIELRYQDWCKAIHNHRYCFRKKGHTGPHATGSGVRLRSTYDMNIFIVSPITKIKIWEE